MANTSAEKKQGTSDIAGLARKVLANTGPLLILVALWIILMILSEPFRNPATWGLLQAAQRADPRPSTSSPVRSFTSRRMSTAVLGRMLPGTASRWAG